MDKRTLKALKGSIRKWGKIVAGTGADCGWRNCPLCHEFLGDECAGCPVAAATNEPYCLDTPYESWDHFHRYSKLFSPPRKIHDDDTAIAAVLELEFLRSLLPEKK